MQRRQTAEDRGRFGATSGGRFNSRPEKGRANESLSRVRLSVGPSLRACECMCDMRERHRFILSWLEMGGKKRKRPFSNRCRGEIPSSSRLIPRGLIVTARNNIQPIDSNRLDWLISAPSVPIQASQPLRFSKSSRPHLLRFRFSVYSVARREPRNTRRKRHSQYFRYLRYLPIIGVCGIWSTRESIKFWN